VLGRWAFRYLELEVDPRVLIPRPETEQVVEMALAELSVLGVEGAGPVVVDLGTGSGAIALSIAVEAGPGRPGLEVWAVEADPAALEVARANRQRIADIDPATAGRVNFRQGSWWEALPETILGRVDLVVANPPYVAEEEWDDLDPEVRHEPKGALVTGPASDGTPGLGAVEVVLAGARRWLRRPGAAIIEIAPHQAEASVRLATGLGFADASVLPDLAGRPRGLVVRR
jgi:release factor glutamine methyltransferase